MVNIFPNFFPFSATDERIDRPEWYEDSEISKFENKNILIFLVTFDFNNNNSSSK
jgi:hypothetical protein